MTAAQFTQSGDTTKAAVLASIPSLKSMILATAQQANIVFSASTQCAALASNFQSAQDAICTSALTGLDLLWLTFLVLGWTGTFSTPVIVKVARGIIRRNRSSNEWDANDKKPEMTGHDNSTERSGLARR